jgi:ABC-type branched-subunit amino acid transport system ATPase component
VLTAEHLTKRFDGLTAVDDLSLTGAPSEIYALLGPNGVGKTTTLETKRRLAYIREQVNLYGHYPTLSQHTRRPLCAGSRE